MSFAHIPNVYLLASDIAERCTNCGACQAQCAFLKKNGTPGNISELVSGTTQSRQWPDAYGCSLCGLCDAVCPEGLPLEQLFLGLRRKRLSMGAVDLKPYRSLLSYESLGDSRLFSLLKLPAGGDTVLFPGCTLAGTGSATVKLLFEALRVVIPDLGIALGCCIKPSHDLGRQEFFEERFGAVLDRLERGGVKRVLTACPNCYKVFAAYGDSLSVESVYETLVAGNFRPESSSGGECVVHDPCPQRSAVAVQDSVRSLVSRCGVNIVEMKNNRSMTLCCGEGGAVQCVNPEYADSWIAERVRQAEGRDILTYCAGCVSFLGGQASTRHVLDVVLGMRSSPSRPPFTYLSRLRLKRWFKNMIG